MQNKITPSEKISELCPKYLAFYTISGAMYDDVPKYYVNNSPLYTLVESPKSDKIKLNSSSTKIFSNFISLCTMFLE